MEVIVCVHHRSSAPAHSVSVLPQALKARCQAVVAAKGKNIPRD